MEKDGAKRNLLVKSKSILCKGVCPFFFIGLKTHYNAYSFL